MPPENNPLTLLIKIVLMLLPVLLAACGKVGPQTDAQAPRPAPSCEACTHTISGYDEAIYALSGGEVICITASGHFAGRINRATGDGPTLICNKGLFQPVLISLHAGSVQIDNYGIFRPGAVNLSPRNTRTLINNHPGAEFRPGAFNLHGAGNEFHNYGTFSPARFSMASGALFINYPGGITTTDLFSLRQKARAINQGAWTLHETIDRDGSSSLQNEGQLQMTHKR